MATLTKALLLRSNAPRVRYFASGTNKSPSNTCGQNSEFPSTYSKQMIKFKKLQQKFQRDDGNPVFLKKGPADRILYLITLGLSLCGCVSSVKLWISLDK